MALPAMPHADSGHALQDVEGSALPAAAKGALRTKLAALQKRVLEEMKAAAAANKARASSAALEAADLALAAGHKFAVMQLQVLLLTPPERYVLIVEPHRGSLQVPDKYNATRL